MNARLAILGAGALLSFSFLECSAARQAGDSIKPGIFDFPVASGSREVPCSELLMPVEEGSRCIEFNVADEDRVIAEYKKLLMDSGWDQEIGDWTVFRRIEAATGCELRVVVFVFRQRSTWHPEWETTKNDDPEHDAFALNAVPTDPQCGAKVS